MSDAEAILRWLVALTVISAALAPAVWWLGRGMDDAAPSLLRTLPLVLLTAVVWWPAAAFGLPFSVLTLSIALLVLGAILWGVWLFKGTSIPWRSWLAFESVWLFLFSIYILFRSYQPNIANTEKPMEIALLSSTSRSAAVPAPDPWFAGEVINYYYFGYQMIATLVKLTGVPSSIAFNLALATLFASVGTIAAGIGFRLSRAIKLDTLPSLVVAATSLFLVVLAGNLETFWRTLRDPGATWATGWWYDGVGWQASRVIVDYGVHGNPDPRGTINEFPAFAFVLGDLHPHVLTYPLFMSVITLAISFVLSSEPLHLARSAGAGALAGLLYVSNSWDAPTGFALVAVAIMCAGGWRYATAWFNVLIAAALAVLTAAPFVRDYIAPVGVDQADIPAFIQAIPVVKSIVETIGIVTWQPSGFGELLIVHGHWILAFAFFLMQIAQGAGSHLHDSARLRIPLVGVLVIVTALAIVWAPALLLLGVPAAIAGILAWRVSTPHVRVTAGLFVAGFVLILIPEFFYIQDAFNDRMNTVFKLYFQAWIPLSVATAATLGLVLSRASMTMRAVGVVVIGGIIVATAMYLPISARDWTSDFYARYGLDGASFIERSHRDDAAAIAWLDANAEDESTIVEAPGCSYGSIGGVPMNRMSAFTGVPTLVGWDGHQRQWRRGEPDPIGPRVVSRQDLANRWLDGDITGSPALSDPDYVVLGSQEASGSPGCDQMPGRDTVQAAMRLQRAGWAIVFESGGTRILARP